jgi:hypothetical protein
MSPLRALKSQILVDGKDFWINDQEFERIRACLPSDGSMSEDDLQVLAEMRAEADVVCEAFDKMFFPPLKKYLLTDGKISRSEQLLLLRILYGGGGIDAAERRFIQELRQELREVTPEFEAIYQDAMRADVED